MILTYLKESATFLKRHNVPDPEISALALVSYVVKQPELNVKLNPEMILTAAQEQELESLLMKRATRYPLQYLIKQIPFRNAILEIGEGCLIPRPETELLIDVVKSRLKRETEPLKILEIGTGSGNIAISLALERPHWTLMATDISDTALEFAKKNSAFNQTTHQIQFIKADLYQGTGDNFDVLVSNPPYVKSSDLADAQKELSYEPVMALDGGEDGLSFYRRLISKVETVLKPDGFVFFEIGWDQAKQITELMAEKFDSIEITKDDAGHDRFISGCFAKQPASASAFSRMTGKNHG